MTEEEGCKVSNSRFASIIDKLICQFLSDSSADPLGLMEFVKREHALPVCLDMGGCYCIRPSGEVISFAWDKEEDITVEACSRIRNIAYYQGSKKYQPLREFTPTRPPDASTCPSCEGKGELSEPFSKVVCYCGGIGWLPPSTK